MNMEYRIEKMDAFRVVGLVTRTTNENGEGMQRIPTFWNEVLQSGKQMDILGLMNRPPFGLIAVNAYNVDMNDAKKLDYYIACATDKPTPDGLSEYTVPGATWAVFPCKRDEVGKTEVRIVMEWQPTSGYELLNSGYETGAMLSGAPDLEVYAQDDTVEIWVAVRKK